MVEMERTYGKMDKNQVNDGKWMGSVLASLMAVLPMSGSLLMK